MTRARSTLLSAARAGAAVALVGLAWTIVDPPGTTLHPSAAAQLVMWVRLLVAGITTATLLAGPGLVLRARFGWPRSLGFVPLPGFLVLTACGAVTWGAAAWVRPTVSAPLLVATVLVLVLVGAPPDPARRADPDRPVWAVCGL